MDMAELNRGSASTRQVTTATPAWLDFRETEISVEGCVNAMSTGSHRSMVRVGGGAQGGVAVLSQTPWRIDDEVGRFCVVAEVCW